VAKAGGSKKTEKQKKKGATLFSGTMLRKI
jgi:hypothetical protein